MNQIETERLIGRKLVVEDYAELRKLHLDPTVMSDIGGIRSEQQSKQNLSWNLEQWSTHGIGLFALIEKENDTVVGFAGLRRIEFLGKQEIDLAYMLFHKYWGQGFATEISRRLLRFAFKEHHFLEVMSKTRTSNLASQKVIAKVGFSLGGEVTEYDAPHFYYRLSRKLWEENWQK